MKPIQLPTHDEIVYTAGFFDADGSVGIYRYTNNGYPSRRVMVTFGQKNPAVLFWLQARWGGSTSTTPNNNGNPLTRLCIVDKSAVVLLAACRLHMIVKQPQADYVISLQKPYTEEQELTLKGMKR